MDNYCTVQSYRWVVILYRNLLHHFQGKTIETSYTLKMKAACLFETSCQTINIRKK